jgi:hypothetical protein
MAEAKTRKNTFFAWISIKQMNELAYQTPEPTLIFNVGQTARTKTKARDRRTLGVHDRSEQ